MFDTHCHLQFNAYKDDAEKVYEKCVAKNMILNVVGSQRDTSARAVEYAHKYEKVYATVGLHPVHLHETHVDEGEVAFKTREENFDYEYYKKLAQDPKTIAIGECGLELFHLPANLDKNEILKKQKEAFLGQYNLAQEFDLPLVIHVREAHTEMIELLKTFNRQIRGVIHCFTGNWNQAQEYLKLGLNLGFTGVITFAPKKTNPQPQIDLIEVIKNCPLDSILVETDAPYLAPQVYRGQRCEPWMVTEVAKEIGKLRALSLDEVITLTEKNGRQLFTKITYFLDS